MNLRSVCFPRGSLCLVPLDDIWDVPKRKGEQANGVQSPVSMSVQTEVEQVVRVIQRKKGGGGAICVLDVRISHLPGS